MGPMGFKAGEAEKVNYSMVFLRAADAKDTTKESDTSSDELKQ